MSNKRERLEQMYAEDATCHWCHKQTVLPPQGVVGRLEPNVATIDHLVMKRFRAKGVPHSVVLACYRCNNIRSHIQSASLKPVGKTRDGRDRNSRMKSIQKNWERMMQDD